MIEVRIPNNIAEYKPKFMFGLTGRQFFCVAVTAVLIMLDLNFLMPYIGDLAILLAAVPAVIAAAFGWIEPYGMPFEKYLQSVLFSSLLAPKCRRAKYHDSTVVPCDKNYSPVSDSAVDPKVLECVNHVRTELGMPIEEAPKKRLDFSGRGPKKAKYRRSKLAHL